MAKRASETQQAYDGSTPLKRVRNKKRRPGKPQTEISSAHMRKAERYAFEGHQNGTICELMDWATSWLNDRKDIRKKLTKKRAERKVWLRRNQNRTAAGKSKSAATMQIFLGKNELGQMDKQLTTLEAGESLAAFLRGLA